MTPNSILVVFGAQDPEAAAAQRLLTAARVPWTRATYCGAPVRTWSAYKADSVADAGVFRLGGVAEVWMFECDVSADGKGCIETLSRLSWDRIGDTQPPDVVVIDHHNKGDLGYGQPPERFFVASSLGQLVNGLVQHDLLPVDDWEELARPAVLPGIWLDSHGRWVVGLLNRKRYMVPAELLLTAAADHCLGAAYAGECPGVDPDALLFHRVAEKAAFQGRSTDEVFDDIAAAVQALKAAPPISIGGRLVANMTSAGPVRELPEAAAYGGRPFIAFAPQKPGDPLRLVLQAAPGHVVRAFLDEARERFRLTTTYGDPARGFAGGVVEDAP